MPVSCCYCHSLHAAHVYIEYGIITKNPNKVNMRIFAAKYSGEMVMRKGIAKERRAVCVVGWKMCCRIR